MAQQVLMPKQGNSVETCIIIEWKKQEGDAVSVGDILCEAETDKATIEVESTAEGIILKQLFKVDDEVPVQVPIVIVGEAGEDISALISAADSGRPSETGDSAEETVTAAPEVERVAETARTEQQAEVESAGSGISPRAKKLAESKGIAYGSLTGSGPKGRIIERDIEASLAGNQPLTPAASSALASGNFDMPESGAGSGIGGRVRVADLQKPVSVNITETVSGDFPGEAVEIPVKSIRKITAKRMFESISTTCQLTLHAAANASRLKEVRARFKNAGSEMGLSAININDLILFAAAKTLVDFPFVNSHFLGDKIIEFKNVHLGTAVDTERGLMVPVIKFADTLTIKELSLEAKRLAESSKTGKIAPDELDGGTFTVTNLGAFGIDHFTPVLNIPQTAILGVCGIDLKPVENAAVEGGVQFVPHINLSLTFDHQAIDGAPAARFLKALADNIGNIDMLLVQ
ncbi:MAG: 2-oxo acid dehydrogenase subunit E2 [Spirochaetia bacterium]|nr:2-oxo acid dehydrogenase subunit E2 [Spirochaetia bacterium]